MSCPTGGRRITISAPSPVHTATACSPGAPGTNRSGKRSKVSVPMCLRNWSGTPSSNEDFLLYHVTQQWVSPILDRCPTTWSCCESGGASRFRNNSATSGQFVPQSISPRSTTRGRCGHPVIGVDPGWSSVCGESPVDDELCSGDERGFVAGQEEHHGSDLGGAACAAHGGAHDVGLLVALLVE